MTGKEELTKLRLQRLLNCGHGCGSRPDIENFNGGVGQLAEMVRDRGQGVSRAVAMRHKQQEGEIICGQSVHRKCSFVKDPGGITPLPRSRIATLVGPAWVKLEKCSH